MLIFLVGTGVYLTIGVKFRTLTRIPQAFKMLMAGRDKDSQTGEGDITPFQSLMTSLAATVGTGNIAGVATAIFLGGPGAIFWMWVTALFGMAIKMGEAVLAVMHRELNEETGKFAGGPMYYIKNGMGDNWNWLGSAFALFAGVAAFGIGCTVQSNSVAQAVHSNFGVPGYVTGIALVVLTYVVIIGGIERIADVTEKLVPIMASVYIIGSIIIILFNIEDLIPAFKLIFNSAFNGHAATGGFAGAAVLQGIRYGVSRGVFSNEAGLGSAAIAHAATTVDRPAKQGIVAMLGGFLDTIVICTMTALIIIMTGAWDSGITGAALTSKAFNIGLPGPGGFIVAFGLIFFSFSTILTWSYYGEKSFEYFFGSKVIMPYRYIWVAAVFLGAVSNLDVVWAIASAMNGLMIVPNLIAVLALSPSIFKEFNEYIDEEDKKLLDA
ncbi:AGCS family alanine or glycine:cation symporter [Halanaerobium congolense]|jgi:AGCS family alanine or glycine:cation symporter|uniref:AGCS family alanine or glycine:cation symporter n=1 Tax=Halanaerobium congolense TaxID=54121 RepID=A0A318E2I6_9FIRM|nr:sodium:alanine symporter family protein [Halanaerobium congolense]PXV61949.1 AGCS family alanine or glycine:cation symporter [Halanaerobium congolense]